MGSPPDGLIRELRGFRRKLSRRLPVRRMLLFGSRAGGRVHRYSDVDLIVVSEKFRGRNAVDRAFPLRIEWDLDYPVDFLCYTPEEFRKLSRRVTLVREAIREGVVIPP